MRHHLINYLEALMKHHGVSKRQLANRCGVPRGTIRNWFEERSNPRLDTLDKAFKAIGYQICIKKIPSTVHERVAD